MIDALVVLAGLALIAGIIWHELHPGALRQMARRLPSLSE